MPPPKAIVCHICNGKYFKRSFPIHLKQCEAKWRKTHTRCEYCGSAVATHDWSDHRAHCKPTKKKLPKQSINVPLEPPKSDYQQVLPAISNNSKVTECEECEAESATWKCVQCEQCLCAVCETELHRKGARSRHTRIPMNADALKQENLSKLYSDECKSNEVSPPEADTQQDHRAQCKFCSRRFNPDRVERHMRICRKAGKKKRRIYDGAKRRIEGTDFEAYQYKRSQTPEKVKEWKKNGRRWRQESDQLRQIAGVPEERKETIRKSEEKEEEVTINKPVIKHSSSTAVTKGVSKHKSNAISSRNKNVSLNGSSLKMKQRPTSNYAKNNAKNSARRYSAKDSARSTNNSGRYIAKNNAQQKISARNTTSKTKEVKKHRISRRQSTDKKPTIPKYQRRKSATQSLPLKRNENKRERKTPNMHSKAVDVSVIKPEVIEKENVRKPQPKMKKAQSEAKSLPRGIDLGVNVNKMFNDAPKTMDDYVERERERRKQRRCKSSCNMMKKSVSKKPKSVDKITKKMSRVQLKKEIMINNQPIGGKRSEKPSNSKDLASKRAAYFETLLQNQE